VGEKKWEAPRGAQGLHYRIITVRIQASSIPGAGGCTWDAGGKTLEDLLGVGTTYLHLDCLATVHPRAAVLACCRHRSTQDARQCCSHDWGARRCDEFPTPRVPHVSPQPEPLLPWWLACANTELGLWPNFRHAHHPWPCTHSLRAILCWQSMSTPAVGAIFADNAGTTTGRLTPCRNGRQQHPPRSTACLRISDSERHISNPKPYVKTPGCRDVAKRRRRIRNRAHEDQFPTQKWWGFWAGCSNTTPPPQGPDRQRDCETQSGAPHRAWAGGHSERHTYTRKASSTHACPRDTNRGVNAQQMDGIVRRGRENTYFPTHVKEKVPTHTQMCPHASTETRKRDTMKKADNILHSPELQLSELDVKCSRCPLFHLASNSSASRGGRKAWERGSRQKRMDENPVLLRYNPTLCSPPARARLADRLTCLPGGGGSL
jgi:hypothetical protein